MHRPVEGNKRVPPRKLKEYRESHDFLGPCCFCPLVGEEKVYKEAIIDITLWGRFKGEYVAECAASENQCNYLGESPYSLK
jgi:hypothetical protein